MIAAGWLVLLVLSQLAALLLIGAGHGVTYQHLGAWSWAPRTLVPAGILFVQAGLVAAGLWRQRAAVRRWLGAAPAWVWMAMVGATVVLAAPALRDVRAWAIELVVLGAAQLVALGNVVLLVTAVPATIAERWERLTNRFLDPSPEPRGSDPVALLLAVWVVVVSLLLNVWSYERHPHVPDEVVYLLQARYFAAGMLDMPLPPVPAAFDIDLMHYAATRWYSPVPPGWPAVLAIGAWLGAPSAVNPVLGGLAVLLTSAVLRGVYSRRVARLGTVLLATSPWFIFLSMSYMNHQATLVFALLAALGVLRIRQGAPRPLWWAVVAGAAIGVTSLIRPLDGVAIALLLGVWSLPHRWWSHLHPRQWAALWPSAMLTLATAATAAIVFPYNKRLTGDAAYYPIMAYIDTYYAPGSNDLGFGANRGLGWGGLDPFPGHGVLDVVVNANFNLTAIQFELFGWATGSLLLVLALFVWGRRTRADWWMVTVCVVFPAIQSLYWFSGGPDFGARYWYPVLVPFIALSARGLESLMGAGQPSAGRAPAGVGKPTLAAAALVVSAMLTVVPWRAIDRYHGYRRMNPSLRVLLREVAFGKSLVLVRGERHPDYASAAIYNPIDFSSEHPLFAWDASPQVRADVIDAYRDRPIWIVDGPTRSGDATYKVVAGPISADSARRFAP